MVDFDSSWFVQVSAARVNLQAGPSLETSFQRYTSFHTCTFSRETFHYSSVRRVIKPWFKIKYLYVFQHSLCFQNYIKHLKIICMKNRKKKVSVQKRYKLNKELRCELLWSDRRNMVAQTRESHTDLQGKDGTDRCNWHRLLSPPSNITHTYCIAHNPQLSLSWHRYTQTVVCG